MTTGIYKLVFAPGVEYIGKSTDIENRLLEHKTSFLRNKAAARMQAAYKQYGMPSAEIMAECHKDHIDFLEEYYIEGNQPVLNAKVLNSSMRPEDFYIVKRNEGLLDYSTIQHFKLIEDYLETIEDLDALHTKAIEENDALREQLNAKLLDSDLYQKVVKVTEEFRLQLQKKEETIAQLRTELKLAKRPWYRKLFG